MQALIYAFLLLMFSLLSHPSYAAATQTVSGNVQIIVDGYIILPPINPVVFQEMNTQNAYSNDSSQSQAYSIQSTFSMQSATPNVSVTAAIDHQHVDQNGAYLVNDAATGKVYFTMNYQSCGNAAKLYSLVTTGSNPLPKIILKNHEVSQSACQIQSGQLFFIRSALQTSPSLQPLPPAGIYTGQITLTVQATSET